MLLQRVLREGENIYIYHKGHYYPKDIAGDWQLKKKNSTGRVQIFRKVEHREQYVKSPPFNICCCHLLRWFLLARLVCNNWQRLSSFRAEKDLLTSRTGIKLKAFYVP